MADPLREIQVQSEVLTPEAIFWQKEVDLAKKREKKWRQKAENVVKLYEGATKAENNFNILYSNTETLLPACYNQLPRPIVERRHKDPDPLARAASTTLERSLSYLLDSPDGEYEPFSDLIEQAVLGALVPGRGLTRFKYDPKFEATATPLGDEEEDGGEEGDGEVEGEEQGHDDENSELLPSAEGRKVVYETVCGEDVDYDSFIMGYARRWKDTPWIAFYHEMSKEDLEDNFGEDVAAVIPLSEPSKKDAEDWKKKEDEDDNEGSIPVAAVWEIWNKAKKQVVFFCEGYSAKIIKTVDDPLKLSGFFPCPAPLTFLLKRSGQVPVPLYTLYENQARELNNLTIRINKVVNAIKVRGFYDGTIQGLQDLLTKEDNVLLPAKNVAGLQDGKNLQNSIWMMPLDELVTVLQQLILAREQCKQTIYEITGIADIMRGQGQASETATAQNIKNQWGTLRVKRLQRYVQAYVRDCLRIMGELAGSFFAPETFAGMTNLAFATAEEVQQAQQMMAQVQQMQLQMQQQPQLPGMPPAAPPQPNPQVEQMAAQAQATLAKPKWDEVVGLLRNDLQRNYRVDIETNSTIDATSQEDKQNITDALSAIANTMQTFAEPLQSGLFPLPALKSMMLSIARRFEFGRQVEEDLEKIPDQPPPPPPDPAEAKKAAAEEQKLQQQQMQLQQKAAEIQMAEKQLAMDKQMALAEIDFKKKKDELEMRVRELEFEVKQAQAEAKMGMMLDKHSMDIERANMAASSKMEMAGMKREQRMKQAAMKGNGKPAAQP